MHDDLATYSIWLYLCQQHVVPIARVEESMTVPDAPDCPSCGHNGRMKIHEHIPLPAGMQVKYHGYNHG